MSDHEVLALESNGLLDFLPTPPESTKESEIDIEIELGKNKKHSIPIFELERERRPDSPVLGYGSPPPEYDEEPSDFEDEVQEIMEREKRNLSPPIGMDFDDEDDMDMGVGMSSKSSAPASAPAVASCESNRHFEQSYSHGHEMSSHTIVASRPRKDLVLTPPPDVADQDQEGEDDVEMEMDAGPQLELLPMFESIAPLRVETAAGKTVIFKRRAKPRPKPIPVRPPPTILQIQDAMDMEDDD